jgi:phosphate transport system protein
MTRHFEQLLGDLRSTLLKMGSLVDEQVELGVRALVTSDQGLAESVIKRDHEVDEFDNRIDELCVGILATTQPVAVDLRLLMASLKINGELERIGDIAVNLAERVKPLAPFQEFVRKAGIEEMALAARAMVKDSIDAFVNSDPALARHVLEADDRIDDLDGAMFNRMMAEMRRSPESIDPASHIMLISRNLERLGDHATNIAEDVIFLVAAKIIKHHGGHEEPLTH